MNKLIDYLTLFSSTTTLVCCALPATLVMLGAGSVMASLAANVPGLIWISSNKVPFFMFAAAMLVLGALLQWRARSLPCPVDPKLAASCMRTRKTSLIVYLVSLIIFLVGGFFAFIAPRLL